jgi:acyl carrier protein
VSATLDEEVIRHWMTQWVAKKMRAPASRIKAETPLAEYGLDSIGAVEFAQDLETWVGHGIEIHEEAMWKYPTIAAMTGYVQDHLRKTAASRANIHK